MIEQKTRVLSSAGLLVRRLLLGGALVGLVASLIGSVAPSVAIAAPPAAAVVRMAPPAPSGPSTTAARDPIGKLNLNTATDDELELLPGVGPAKAGRIVEFRTKHGPFKRVFDLRRVKGFGKKTVDRLAPLLTVTEKTSMRRTE